MYGCGILLRTHTVLIHLGLSATLLLKVNEQNTKNETTITFQYKYKIQKHTYTPIRDHVTLACHTKYDHTINVAGCNRHFQQMIFTKQAVQIISTELLWQKVNQYASHSIPYSCL